MNNSQPIASMPADAGRKAEHNILWTIRATIAVPLLASLVTAIIAAILVRTFSGDAIDPWLWPWRAFAIVLSLFWTIYLWRWFTLTARETPAFTDAPEVVAPVPAPRVTRIVIDATTEQGHYKQLVTDLPIEPERLKQLAYGLCNGVPFSMRAWTGEGKLLTTAEYQAIRTNWINRGLLELVSEKDRRQGYRRTALGVRVTEKLAETASPSGENDD